MEDGCAGTPQVQGHQAGLDATPNFRFSKWVP